MPGTNLQVTFCFQGLVLQQGRASADWRVADIRLIARVQILDVEQCRAVQLPYLHLLQALRRACPASTVILLELPAVSLRLGRRAADVDAIASAAVAAAQQHASLPACFVAHSFGTFCVSRICQLQPAAVQSVVSCLPSAHPACDAVPRQPPALGVDLGLPAFLQ